MARNTLPKRRAPSLLLPQSFVYICSMNFEAFLHFQEKHRAFLEEEDFRKLQEKESGNNKSQPDNQLTKPSEAEKKRHPLNGGALGLDR